METTLNKATALIREALDILDAGGAPADIGAHLDLALARIEERLALLKQPTAKLGPNRVEFKAPVSGPVVSLRDHLRKGG